VLDGDQAWPRRGAATGHHIVQGLDGAAGQRTAADLHEKAGG